MRKTPAKRFVLDWSAEEQAAVEAYRAKNGLRSQAAALRHMIHALTGQRVEAERDGLARSRVDTNRLARAGNSFDVQGTHTVQPDNPTKSLAAQGKTRETGSAKTSATPSIQIGPAPVAPGSRLKQPKVKK